MSAQRQKPIDFAAEGLRLALFVDRNCGIRVQSGGRIVDPLEPLEGLEPFELAFSYIHRILRLQRLVEVIDGALPGEFRFLRHNAVSYRYESRDSFSDTRSFLY